MKYFYLIAAVAGAIVPYLFFFQFFISEGVVVTAFISALFANGASSGFTADLLISSTVFWAYLISRKEPLAWLYILINLTIGLSCAIPLYLFNQVRQAEAAAAS